MRSLALNRHDDLQSLLEQLSLGGMAATCADLALKAAKEGLSHEAYLYELAKRELDLRRQRRVERRLSPIMAAAGEDLSHPGSGLLPSSLAAPD